MAAVAAKSCSCRWAGSSVFTTGCLIALPRAAIGATILLSSGASVLTAIRADIRSGF
ncbi:MAG: hypothetical protein RQM90_03170 [Methanoculleus sp.]